MGRIYKNDIPYAMGRGIKDQADWNESNIMATSFIKNKPNIPTVTDTYNSTSANAMSGKAVASALSNLKIPVLTSDPASPSEGQIWIIK